MESPQTTVPKPESANTPMAERHWLVMTTCTLWLVQSAISGLMFLAFLILYFSSDPNLIATASIGSIHRCFDGGLQAAISVFCAFAAFVIYQGRPKFMMPYAVISLMFATIFLMLQIATTIQSYRAITAMQNEKQFGLLISLTRPHFDPTSFFLVNVIVAVMLVTSLLAATYLAFKADDHYVPSNSAVAK